MAPDRSLDEFLDGEESDGESTPDGEPGSDGEAASDEDPGAGEASPPDRDPGPSDDDIEPARSTYEWAPGGADCGRCGATVARRWRDDEGTPVCGDCKEW